MPPAAPPPPAASSLKLRIVIKKPLLPPVAAAPVAGAREGGGGGPLTLKMSLPTITLSDRARALQTQVVPILAHFEKWDKDLVFQNPPSDLVVPG